MAPGEVGRGQMEVWCPLIPPDQIQNLFQHKNDLSKINEAYDDWRSSMRGKEFVSVNPGVFLDRIRMLMINVGISCGRNRDLAEEVQSIVAKMLRERALSTLSAMSINTSEQNAVKETLIAFFTDLKFTRDVYPIEELRNCVVLPHSSSASPGSSGFVHRLFSQKKGEHSIKKKTVEASLFQCTSILKRLYIRLLSPDPWGTE
jgi:hypothetical protein